MYNWGEGIARVWNVPNSINRMEQLTVGNEETRADFEWWVDKIYFNERKSGKGWKFWGCQLISDVIGVY